jgi:protocatechuate 3,4-dioxygenase beta subunit
MTDQRASIAILEPDDDAPVGRVLSRREVLALFGMAGAAVVVAACTPAAVSTASLLASAAPLATTASTAAAGSAAIGAVPACVVVPALTEGPYFVNEKLNRSDIRTDPSSGTAEAGVPLTLTFGVAKVIGSACTAYEGAVVDVWHCSALGVYSDATDSTFGNTTGKKFLRGYQVTDPHGNATFVTIYPGWYQGRTVHIHFKVRTSPDATSGTEFTSQLFFDDTLSDKVFAVAPYAQKGANRGTKNSNDGIFQQSNGQLTLEPTGDVTNGFKATFAVGIQAA